MIAFLILLIVSCTPSSIPIDKPYNLKIGRWYQVENTVDKLRIKIIDSIDNCPPSAHCLLGPTLVYEIELNGNNYKFTNTRYFPIDNPIYELIINNYKPVNITIRRIPIKDAVLN